MAWPEPALPAPRVSSPLPPSAPGSRLQAPLPKIQPLYPSAKSNLRDRVLGGIEKESFITLPDKGGHTGILPLKTMCPNLGEFNDGFITCGSQVRSLTRLEYEQGFVQLLSPVWLLVTPWTTACQVLYHWATWEGQASSKEAGLRGC